MDEIYKLTYDRNKMHIVELPNEITSMILRSLDSRSLVNASRVCRHWSHVCQTDSVLRTSIHWQEVKRKKLRWCRAKYGDGTLKREQFFRGSKEVMLKRKYKTAQFQLLMTLIHIRKIWQGFYDSLLAL